eukprot:379102_1
MDENERFNFDRWVKENELESIKQLLHKHGVDNMQSLTIHSDEFENFICDPFIGKHHQYCQFIPKIFCALKHFKPPQSKQNANVLNDTKIFLSREKANILSNGYIRTHIKYNSIIPIDLIKLCSLWFNNYFEVDDVVVTSEGVGVIKYIENMNNNNNMVGLLMDEPNEKYYVNGTLNDKKYFDFENSSKKKKKNSSNNKRCYFTKSSHILEYLFSIQEPEAILNNKEFEGKIKIGQRIQLNRAGEYGYITGIIKYYGNTQFNKNENKLIGLETDFWYVNNNNGIMNDVTYFIVNRGTRGFWTDISSVIDWNFTGSGEWDNEGENTWSDLIAVDSYKEDIRIGDRVKIICGET